MENGRFNIPCPCPCRSVLRGLQYFSWHPINGNKIMTWSELEHLWATENINYQNFYIMVYETVDSDTFKKLCREYQECNCCQYHINNRPSII